MPEIEQSERQRVEGLLSHENRSSLVKLSGTNLYLACHLMKNSNWRVRLVSLDGKKAGIARSISREELVNLILELSVSFHDSCTLKDVANKSKEIIKNFKKTLCQKKA
jgi:hypothetical protein